MKKRGKKSKAASSVARRASGDKNRIINDHAIHSSNVTCSSPFVFNNIKFNQSTVCVHKNWINTSITISNSQRQRYRYATQWKYRYKIQLCNIKFNQSTVCVHKNRINTSTASPAVWYHAMEGDIMIIKNDSTWSIMQECEESSSVQWFSRSWSLFRVKASHIESYTGLHPYIESCSDKAC